MLGMPTPASGPVAAARTRYQIPRHQSYLNTSIIPLDSWRYLRANGKRQGVKRRRLQQPQLSGLARQAAQE
jgi:hypothetical protein